MLAGGFITSFLCLIILIPLSYHLAHRAEWLDIPDGDRKFHRQATPRLGGVCIFSVFLFLSGFFHLLHWSVTGSLALVLVFGLYDDAYGLRARYKFALHFLAAVILVLCGGQSVSSLGNIFGQGNIELSWLAIPFTIACVVYMQNAINMLDGLDGLAGLYSALVFGIFLAVTGDASAFGNNALCFAVLLGGLAGFLMYNMRSPFIHDAKIFLGDAGSMALGLMMAWGALSITQSHSPVLSPLSVAWILAFPIWDSFAVMVTRLVQRQPPFKADRRHFHYQVQDRGWGGHGAAMCITALYAIILMGVGFLPVAEPILGWGWIIGLIGHTAFILSRKS